MVTIPTGSFMMGCNIADADADADADDNYDNNCDSDEKPYHEVILDEYQIDISEVTVAEYKLGCNIRKLSY